MPRVGTAQDPCPGSVWWGCDWTWVIGRGGQPQERLDCLDLQGDSRWNCEVSKILGESKPNKVNFEMQVAYTKGPEPSSPRINRCHI